MAVKILDQAETYRLITDENGHYAVIEARAGHVYSLHCHHRRSALDTSAGMEVILCDCWGSDENEARERFDQMVRRERRYSEILW